MTDQSSTAQLSVGSDEPPKVIPTTAGRLIPGAVIYLETIGQDLVPVRPSNLRSAKKRRETKNALVLDVHRVQKAERGYNWVEVVICTDSGTLVPVMPQTAVAVRHAN